MGVGKSKETVPYRDKAKRIARINLIRVRRGCGSWESGVAEPNTIPFAVEGRCGSVRLKLMPAPKGKGLCVEKECAKVLYLGWGKRYLEQNQRADRNQAESDFRADGRIEKLSEVKVRPEHRGKLAIMEGKLKEKSSDGVAA